MVKEIEAILCFSIFGKYSKWPPFLRRGKFFQNWQEYNFLYTLWVENFDEIALSRTVKEIEAILCFAIFGKNSKWPPLLGRGKFFENWQEYIPKIPCGSKKFDETALSRTVKEIQATLCFSIFGKNSKSQNGHHFWGGENFLKIAKSTFL